MFELSDFIHGDKFTEFCDYVIPENDSVIDISQLERNALVFVKTDKIPEFFSIVKKLPFKYGIVSHNSDHNITEEVYETKPINVLFWFAQNALIDKKDLVPIPIGVERPGIAGSGDMNVLLEVLKEPVEIKNKIYMNFAWQTNPEKRKPMIEKMKDFPDVTYQKERIPFRQYLKEIREHKYVICPPGNGHDTHRLWETLYLDRIPVMHESLIDLSYPNILKMSTWKNLILRAKNDIL